MSEWNLYLLLAQMLGETTDLEKSVLRANAEHCWPDLLSLSSNCMVTTQLYWVLKSAPSAWQKIDTDSQEYLQHIFELNGERNAQLIDESKDILSVLNRKKITPLLLKGTGQLLSEEYPHMAYRMQLDIDFLVLPEDLEKAASGIREMGYCYAEETDDGLEIASGKRVSRLLKIYKDHKHLPPLLNPEKRVLLELHRHPYSKRFQKYFPVSDIFKRAQLKNMKGLSWYLMSPGDQMHLLLTEGYIDAGYKRAFQLPLRLARDYLDISDKDDDVAITVNKSLVKKQLFPEELITAVLNPSEQAAPTSKISNYLRAMEKIEDNPFVYRAVNLYANFVRRTINLAYSPSLLRRLF